mgnify:CR=1 FL=1
MKLTSKFDLNQQVYTIIQDRKTAWEECSTCDGRGKVTIKNEQHDCPKCRGSKGEYVYLPLAWHVDGPMTIGKIRYEVTNIEKTGMFDNIGEYAEGKDEHEVEYMCYETGIGAGTLWHEERLYTTAEEAQADCDRKNEVPQ